MKEEAKIKFLLNKVHHPLISNIAEALEAIIITELARSITLMAAENHLAEIVSEFPDHISMNRTILLLRVLHKINEAH